jgi:aspartyl-tRNA(Asn)/glutamyl-tRNA(Gln) amidotransferase subunit C
MLAKKDLEKLAELSRLEIKPAEEEKFLKGLGAVLDHFEELKTIQTDGVTPMTGGTEFKNVFREDEEGNGLSGEAAKKEFPESEKGYLKVPPVF